MQWLEVKYIGLLSNRLRNFKKKSESLYNFSCPLCGDSETRKTKARAYIFNKGGTLLFHCHNCGISLPINKFLENVDYNLYQEYVMEYLSESKTERQKDLEEFTNKMKSKIRSDILKGLSKVSQLSPNHPIKKLVSARKIPNEYHHKLYACPNFMAFTNTIIPGKFSDNALKYDEMRLLIPFINSSGIIHGYQGRALKTNDRGAKYITIVVDESIPKLYGFDTVSFNKPVYVFEGPIDSMFVPNSIATAGGEAVSALKGFDKENLVIIYDNEPRSKETVKKVNKAIVQGFKVCIWPEFVKEKDVNDMILNGMSQESIAHIIRENTFFDLEAKLKLSQWSKI